MSLGGVKTINISDGFHELFAFRSHVLIVKNFGRVETDSKLSRDPSAKQLYYSLDAKQVYVWECGKPPEYAIKFPKTQPNFINAFVYMTKYGYSLCCVCL